MCVSATVRSALDHGYASTVVAAACATRDLPDPLGGHRSAPPTSSAWPWPSWPIATPRWWPMQQRWRKTDALRRPRLLQARQGRYLTRSVLFHHADLSISRSISTIFKENFITLTTRGTSNN
jgi:hypothetical protein